MSGDLLEQTETQFRAGSINSDNDNNEVDEKDATPFLRQLIVKDILNQHTFDDAHALDIHLLIKISSYTLNDLQKMDYISEITPLLSQMEDNLSERGVLVEDEESGGFSLVLAHPIQVGPTKMSAISLSRPTLNTFSSPGSRNKGEVRRHVKIIRNLTGLTNQAVHDMSVVDYLTIVEQFQIWRDS